MKEEEKKSHLASFLSYFTSELYSYSSNILFLVFLASIIVITPGPNILLNYKNNRYFGIFVHNRV